MKLKPIIIVLAMVLFGCFAGTAAADSILKPKLDVFR